MSIFVQAKLCLNVYNRVEFTKIKMKPIKKSMLNSAEHEINPAHKVKMPTIVGVITFISSVGI